MSAGYLNSGVAALTVPCPPLYALPALCGYRADEVDTHSFNFCS